MVSPRLLDTIELSFQTAEQINITKATKCVLTQWFISYVKKQKMTTMLVLDNGLYNT